MQVHGVIILGMQVMASGTMRDVRRHGNRV
jgi:hypothetical protein